MQIHFKNIIPHPLKETVKDLNSEIWDQTELVLDPSERILVQAPSGKGKSTFLNIIYGIREDYDGELVMGTTRTIENSSHWDSLRKETISMVFQGLELFDHLTAWENIQLKNEITNHKTADQIQSMLERLEIIKVKNQITKTLSFGQKQRVAIIRALCQPFSWLLLDEPFSHLDMDNSTNALQLISEEADQKNAGVVLTSLGELTSDYFTKSVLL